MTLRVEALLRQAVAGREEEDYVLRRPNGAPIRDFRKTWEALTKRAGLPKLMVHDLRRSAAKALRKAGVPESVIMATGVGRRPACSAGMRFVSSADQRDAMEKLELDRARDQARNSPVLSPFSKSTNSSLDEKLQ